MASLFLSYSRDDARRVEPLAAALEGLGHTVWWDRHLSGGQEFVDAIEQALESADVVIACWTTHSVHSAWVRDEAGHGRDRGRLVPVTLDGSLPPLGFRQYHTIDLSRWSRRPKSSSLEPLNLAIAERSSGTPQPMVEQSRAMRLRSRLGPRSRAVLAAGAVVLLAGGAFLYPRVLAGQGNIEPKVAVGQFGLVSAGLPRGLPNMVGQEIVAAFGAENAVTVIAPGDRKAKSAPFVMDGSISSIGPAVRFTVNLRNQRTGVVIWSSSYEHEAADAVAARQAAVGASQVIRCGLWGASSYKKRMSDEALSLYFKWCNEHWSGSTSETAELDAARRVTAVVPDFSFGWSAMALAAMPLAAVQSADARQLRSEAQAAARKSMALDRENPEGYMALAGLLPLDRYAEREGLLKRALGVRPTECGCERQAYGDFLASVGRMEEAVEQYEQAREMRPLAPFSNLRFAQALYMVGRNKEADRVLATTLELWPGATSLRLLKIKSALWTRRYDDAITQLDAADLPLTSAQRDTLADAFAALKSRSPSQRAKSIGDLESFAADPRYNDKVVVGVLAALGARNAAIKAAANLVRTRGLFDAEVLFEPNMAAARSEPGYADLVRKLGLLGYWQSAPNPPDICRGTARPSFCTLA
ncbi:toll/interleukin-1 receptor domain-containing protein [Sphingomonas sp.]|uniref:toll/interleukin-1 receptor domain-containing protein n=1 Tax=Sphingomonas sp. TaxID=28214 RepID=UPI0025E1439C|nr:toll/interleukin-1 receptor domain-containing protein [Sphingomonas sp.]